MLNKREMLLIILAEECNEVAQRVTKALRFGLDEVQRDQDKTNEYRIKEEFCDLLAVMELCQEEGMLTGGNMEARLLVIAKKNKVKRYMEYSLKECGTMTEEKPIKSDENGSTDRFS